MFRRLRSIPALKELEMYNGRTHIHMYSNEADSRAICDEFKMKKLFALHGLYTYISACKGEWVISYTQLFCRAASISKVISPHPV